MFGRLVRQVAWIACSVLSSLAVWGCRGFLFYDDDGMYLHRPLEGKYNDGRFSVDIDYDVFLRSKCKNDVGQVKSCPELMNLVTSKVEREKPCPAKYAIDQISVARGYLSASGRCLR